jgi:hypothetical protein
MTLQAGCFLLTFGYPITFLVPPDQGGWLPTPTPAPTATPMGDPQKARPWLILCKAKNVEKAKAVQDGHSHTEDDQT